MTLNQAHAAKVGSPYFEATALQKMASSSSSSNRANSRDSTMLDFDAENSMIARAALDMMAKMEGFELLNEVCVCIYIHISCVCMNEIKCPHKS
jgi:hypothetical protein